jgi:hypothetical protein
LVCSVSGQSIRISTVRSCYLWHFPPRGSKFLTHKGFFCLSLGELRRYQTPLIFEPSHPAATGRSVHRLIVFRANCTQS